MFPGTDRPSPPVESFLILLQFLFLMVHELSFMLWTIQKYKTTHLESVQHIVGKHKQTSVQRQAMLSWQTRNQRSHDVLDFTERRIKAFRQHAGELIQTQLGNEPVATATYA